MSTTNSDTTIASFHDVHFGHPNTRYDNIIRGMEKDICATDPFIRNLTYLFYPGDVFDRLLILPEQGIPAIRREFRRQLEICQAYGISVRVLEGTPSHDWHQSKLIMSVAEEMGFTGDLKYIDTLCVEITPKGHSILYIPDEWRTDLQQTYLEALEAIKVAGLERVDYCLFHGQFTHQFPPEWQVGCHDADAWQSLVKHYLFAGHIHTPSRKGKILVAGSYDRLRHGEEHPKGHYRVTVKTDGDDIIEFVENKEAKIYLTLDVSGQSVESIYGYVESKIHGLPVNSFIRLSGNRDQSLRMVKKALSDNYPEYRWDIIFEKTKKQPRTVSLDSTPIQKTTVTLGALEDAILLRLEQSGLSPQVIDHAKQLYKDSKHEFA